MIGICLFLSELFYPWPQNNRGGGVFSLLSHFTSFPFSPFMSETQHKECIKGLQAILSFLTLVIIQSKLISHSLVWISLITLTELKCAVESYFLGFYFMEMWFCVQFVGLNAIVMLDSVLRHFPNSLEGKFNIKMKAVIICSKSRFVSVLCTLLEEISLPRW